MLASLFSLVDDINPGGGNSSPGGMAHIDGRVFFTAQTGSGAARGASIFTIEYGVNREVVSINSTGARGTVPLVNVGDVAYFSAGNRLWRFIPETNDLIDVYAQMSVNLGQPSNMDAIGNTLLFTATDNANVQNRFV